MRLEPITGTRVAELCESLKVIFVGLVIWINPGEHIQQLSVSTLLLLRNGLIVQLLPKLRQLVHDLRIARHIYTLVHC